MDALSRAVDGIGGFERRGIESLLGETPQMHAREEIKHILIERKLRRWCGIAQCPLLDLRCPPWRARKNFWRLCRKYPEVAARLGLTVLSVFGRL
jgi:hypothetical protein